MPPFVGDEEYQTLNEVKAILVVEANRGYSHVYRDLSLQLARLATRSLPMCVCASVR